MEFDCSGSNPDEAKSEQPGPIASDVSISTNSYYPEKNGDKVRNSQLNCLSKYSTQIRKPPCTSSSPINWFPRKKTESFLKRKLRLLQESEGACSSLDETLGSANPHYTRMAREKIAAHEAAKKAMNARKVAMIEASWCRILHAARIHNKHAEERHEKAEREVEKAFEEASSMGVTIYDRLDGPLRPCEVEKSLMIGGVSSHTIAASFETAFEVDKEVAMAVKNAFIRMARYRSSSNRDEFKELLHKISENPEEVAVDQDIDPESTDAQSDENPANSNDDVSNNPQTTKFDQNIDFGSGSAKGPVDHDVDPGPRDAQSNQNLANSDDNVRNNPQTTKSDQNINFGSADVESQQDLVNVMFDRISLLSEEEISSLAIIVATTGLNAALERSNGPSGRLTAHFMQGRCQAKVRESGVAIPSLDKFLVKHISKLEKEVQEAKMISKTTERNVAKTMGNNLIYPDLGSILIKHVSNLEREIHSFKDSCKRQKTSGPDPDEKKDVDVKGMEREKENLKQVNAKIQKGQHFEETWSKGLDQILVKHKSKLEKAKLEASSQGWSMPSLDLRKKEQNLEVGPSLDQIRVKYKCNLQNSEPTTMQNLTEERAKSARTWRAARDQKVQEEWGGLSLANSLKPSLSRLEREKAAWKKAEEEEAMRARAL